MSSIPKYPTIWYFTFLLIAAEPYFRIKKYFFSQKPRIQKCFKCSNKNILELIVKRNNTYMCRDDMGCHKIC